MTKPWQNVPTDVLDDQRRAEEAQAWGDTQRRSLAAEWAKMHLDDLDAMAQQYGVDRNYASARQEPILSDPWAGMAQETAPVPMADYGVEKPFGVQADPLAQEKLTSFQGSSGRMLEEGPYPGSLPTPGYDPNAGVMLPPEQQPGPFDRLSPDQPPFPPFTRLNAPGLPGMALPVAPVPPKPVPPSEEEQQRVLEGRPFRPEDAVSELGKFFQQQGGTSSPAGLMDVVIPEEKAGRIVRAAGERGGFGGTVSGPVRAAGEVTGGSEAGSALGRQAEETLERARGTAEEAAQLRPERAGRAGNVNLGILPEDVRDSVAETVRLRESNEFAGQRRGVVSDPEASKQAVEVAARTSVEDWLKSKPGRAFSQPEVEALGDTIVRTTRELDELRAQNAEKVAAGVEDRVLQARVAEKGLESAALIGVFTGASAEAGRALRQFRRALTGVGASRVDAVRAAFKAIGTDEDAFKDWITKWDATDPSDLRARQALVSALHTPSRMEKLLAWTTSNMLSGLKSIMIQAVSAVNESVNRPLITLLDGDASAAADDVVAMANATGRAWGAAKEALLTGVRQSRLKDLDEPTRLDLIRPEAFPGKEGLVKTPALRVIGAEDEFFRTVNAAGAAANYARTVARNSGRTVEDVLANPTDEMLAYIDREAKRSVFEGAASPIAKKLIEIRQMAVTGQGVGAKATGLVANVLVPFVKIPDVIYRTGVGMMAEPVMPFARGVVRGYRGEPAVQKGEIGRARLATLLLTGYFGLAATGNLTGNGPKDPAKRRVLMEARDDNGDPVWVPHSVRVPIPGVGVRWFDYTNLGPPSIPMGVMANAVEVYREEGTQVSPEYAKETINRTGAALLDASYIDTVGRLMRAVGEGRLADLPTELGQSALGRFVPYGGLVAQIARTAEGEVKKPRNPLEAVAARIPGVSELVPERISPLGGPVKAPEDVLSLISPVRTSARGEPNRVALVLAEHNVGIGGPPTSWEGIPFDEKDRRRFEETAGPIIREELEAIISDPEFGPLSPPEKRSELQLAVSRGRKAAADEILDALGEEELERRLQRVEGLPIGGYVGAGAGR